MALETVQNTRLSLAEIQRETQPQVHTAAHAQKLVVVVPAGVVVSAGRFDLENFVLEILQSSVLIRLRHGF